MTANSSRLRDQLLNLLRESTTSAEEDLLALGQCAAHIRNRRIVGDVADAADACGMTLTGFLMNDQLELYYDIKRGRHSMGYIAKGWQDPGFRIGDVLEIDPWEADVFHAHLLELITVATKPTGTEVHVDGVLCSAGFNAETFRGTLESLNECLEKISSVSEGGAHGRHPAAGYITGGLAHASGRSH
jgi:hypothetical protein